MFVKLNSGIKKPGRLIILGFLAISICVIWGYYHRTSWTDYQKKLNDYRINCPFDYKIGSPIPWLMSLNFNCLSDGRNLLFLADNNNGFFVNTVIGQEIKISVTPLFSKSDTIIEINDRDGGHLISDKNDVTFSSNYNGIFYVVLKVSQRGYPYLVDVHGSKKIAEPWRIVMISPSIDHRFCYSFKRPSDWVQDPNWSKGYVAGEREIRYIANSFVYYFDGNKDIPYYLKIWNLNRDFDIKDDEEFITKNGYKIKYSKNSGNGWNARIFHPNYEDVIVSFNLPKLPKEHEAEVDQNLRKILESFNFTDYLETNDQLESKTVDYLGLKFPVSKNEKWIVNGNFITVERWSDKKMMELIFDDVCCAGSTCRLTDDQNKKLCTGGDKLLSDKFNISIVGRIQNLAPGCLDKGFNYCPDSEIISVNGELNGRKFAYQYESYYQTPPTTEPLPIDFYLPLKNDKYLFIEWTCNFANTKYCISSILDFALNTKSD